MEEWRKNSWEFQQSLFRQLGNRKWDDICGDKNNVLQKSDLAFENCYGKNYLDNKIFKKITDKVKTELSKFFEEKHYDKHFSCTFLNMKMKKNYEGLYCVFWLQNANDSEILIDLSGRSYTSWKDFLKLNVLPKCTIVYPKYGRYYHESYLKENYVDVVCEESEACRLGSCVKNILDVVTTVGGMAAAGVFVFNPVSAGVIIGATSVVVATGVYGVGNNVNTLIDIQKHDGGLSLNSKTLLTIGELVITAAGTAAVGVAAGIKGFVAKTGAVLAEGSMAFKVASNVGKITRVFSGINVAFNMIVIIDKFKRDCKFVAEDLLHLSKIIFFSFNMIVSKELLALVISFVAEHFSLNQIIQNVMQSPQIVHTVVRKCCRFVLESDLHKVLQQIFPNFGILIQKISIIARPINTAARIADRTSLAILNKRYDVEYVLFLQMQLKILWTEVSDSKEEIAAMISYFKIACEEPLRKFIEKILNSLGLGDPPCPNLHVENKTHNDFSFNCRINTPVEMKTIIAETVAICWKHIDSSDELKEKENRLFLELSKLVSRHSWENKSSTYILSKIGFYCKIIQTLYKDKMDNYQFKYFLHTINYDKNVGKYEFFQRYYELDSIQEHVYKFALSNLTRNIQHYHEEFEKDIADSLLNDHQKAGVIYEFEMLCSTPKLSVHDYYDKAKELIPRLDYESTSYDSDNNGLFIIRSNKDDFVIIIHTVMNDFCVKGIMLFSENNLDVSSGASQMINTSS